MSYLFNIFNSSKKLKIFFLFLIIFICFYRSPFIFLNGRFVAEEGSFFFRNAYLFGPIEGLMQHFIRSSYFNLWANISSVVATTVPLIYAPLVTVYMAFLIKLTLISYILFVSSSFFKDNFQRYFIALLIIFSPPMSIAEIWLNTLVSQIYLSLIVFFIFFTNSNNKFLNNLSLLIIVISCLSSVVACIFTLGFIIKYYLDRNKVNLYQLITISIASLLQFIIFIFSKVNYDIFHAAEERYLISSQKIISLFYNAIIKTFLNRDLTQFIYFKYNNEQEVFYLIICLFFLLLFIFFIIKNINKLVRDKIFLIILLFFISQILLAFFGSKAHEVAGRYVALPGILLIFLVFRIYLITKKLDKKFFQLVLFIPLITGIYEFKENNKYPQFFSCYNCPDWKNEIKKWQKDRAYKIKIWQYPMKTMSLN